MSGMPMARFRRFESLDHLRGFAALWVVIFHAFAIWIDDGTVRVHPALAWFALNGWRGVEVFFVISGYCITERLARDWMENLPTERFLRDRAWRIFPAYWAALGLAILISAASVPFNHTPLLAANGNAGAIPTSALAWLQMLTLSEVWFEHPTYLLVSWTLTYEIVFYAFAAGAFLFARTTGRAALAFAFGAVLALVGLFHPPGAFSNVLHAFASFYLGSLVWLLTSRPALPASIGRATILAAGALGLVVVLGLAAGSSGRTAVVTALALWLIHRVDAKFAAAHGLRWLGLVGRFSFSLYLVHAPVVGKIRNLAGRWIDSSPTGVAVALAACGVAVAVAWTFFVMVERPLETLRKMRFSRVSPQPAAAQA